MIRVVDKKDGSRKRISPIWIMEEHRNKGYAQAAMKEAERIHEKNNWSLAIILQEKGNLYLFMNIYTMKEWQRQGIAGKMLSMLIDEA